MCRSSRVASILTTLFFAAAVAALAADTPKQEGAPPPMTPEEQAMMAAWQKASTPGQQHRRLAGLAGSWTVATSFRMAPEKPWEKSTGTAERVAILGGRVLTEKVQGTMMGGPFEGMGWSGYDNVSGQYWGTWVDSMGTGVMTMVGSCDADGKRCEFKGTYNDPISGKAKVSRMTTERTGPNAETSHFYDVGKDGKEFVSGELLYTRKK